MTADTPPTTPAQHASAAADALRSLNYAASGRSLSLGDAHDTLDELATVARRLPQALTLIQATVTRLHDDGQLIVDVSTSRSVDSHLGELTKALRAANAAASIVATSLDLAHTALDPVTYRE